MILEQFLSDETHGRLPNLLKDTVGILTIKFERDIVLLSTLGLISGAVPDNQGVYHRKNTFPNFNLFVVAHAASGKGIMNYARRLFESYNEFLKRLGHGESKARRLFLPGNTSATALYISLEANAGRGVVFETEADSVTTAMGQEWGGGVSELIRMSFTGETVSLSRVKDARFIEIRDSRLAVLVSGTPSQVQPFIVGTENGLFSRFLFYSFKGSNGWSDVFDETQNNLDEHFNNLVPRYLEMIKFSLINKFKLIIPSSQRELFNSHFSELFIGAAGNPVLLASIKRLGVIAFKICLCLAAVRKFDANNTEDTFECNMDDLKTSLDITSVGYANVKAILDELNSHRSFENNQKFIALLPRTVAFKREEAVLLGQSVGIGERKVDKMLKELLQIGTLMQPEYGTYQFKPVGE